MKYTRNDLENIIAICEQDSDNIIAMNLSERCKKALAYNDISVRFTKNDKHLLALRYDEDMDEDAKHTLERLGIIARICCHDCGKFILAEEKLGTCDDIRCVAGSYDNGYYDGRNDVFYCKNCGKKHGFVMD